MTRLATLCLVFSFLLPSLTRAEDWPQFRGPGGQGHSAARGLPLTWSEDENITWKVPVAGRGWSSPAVQGRQIWLTTALNDARSLRGLCFDPRTGRLLHDVEVFRLPDLGQIHAKNSHASPTPIIDEDGIYLHFGAHGTACLSRDGRIRWRTTLEYDHRNGPGGSPILFGNLLILSCDGIDAQFVVGLDKRTGQVRWKQARNGRMAYSTPLLVNVNGRPQVISTCGDYVGAYDARTGKEIWRSRYDGYSLIPRPVFGQGLVFVCSGFHNPVLYAIRPDGRGDVTDTHVAWSLRRRGVPLTPSPLLVDRELYLVNDQGIASCLDARTGKAHWRERLGGAFSASPLLADGRMYLLNEDGVTTVLAPSTRFTKLAANHLDGRTLASMAVAEKALYVRSERHLYRIECNGQKTSQTISPMP